MAGGMFDVSHKLETLRIAVAQAIVKVNPVTINLIKEGKSPKGDICEAVGSQQLWQQNEPGTSYRTAIRYP